MTNRPIPFDVIDRADAAYCAAFTAEYGDDCQFDIRLKSERMAGVQGALTVALEWMQASADTRTLYVGEETAERFKRFAERRGLTIEEAFMALLDSADDASELLEQLDARD